MLDVFVTPGGIPVPHLEVPGTAAEDLLPVGGRAGEVDLVEGDPEQGIGLNRRQAELGATDAEDALATGDRRLGLLITEEEDPKELPGMFDAVRVRSSSEIHAPVEVDPCREPPCEFGLAVQ